MISLAVNGYTENEIKDQLHSKSGKRLVKYRYELLNLYDIKQGVLDIKEGSTIKFDAESLIKRTGTFQIKENEALDIDWLNDRIRPVFCLQMPDGGFAEYSLGIFLMPSSKREELESAVMRPIEAYDPTQILIDDKFTERYRITAGTTYVSAIKTILTGAGITKINITNNSGSLATDKEFKAGTQKVIAVNQLLGEINYSSIWVDQNGYFNAAPYKIPSEREAEYTYEDDDKSVIFPDCIDEADAFNVPNIWIVAMSNPEKSPLIGNYKNDLSTSPTSTVNRKRNIVRTYTIDDILDQTTLNGYTRRLAYNDSQIYNNFNFNTAPMPHHSYSDCLFIKYSKYGLAVKYIETSWSMNLIQGNRMAHNCRRVIYI